MNSAQIEAAHAIEARLLVRAAPGSGKTRTLVERVTRLLETGSHPAELLVVTFTRKAAAELRERLEHRVPGKPPAWWRQLHALTFHAWACKVIRTYHDKVGLPRNFSIRDEQDRESLILYAARELGLCPAPGEKKRSGQWTSARRLWEEEAVRICYRQLLREAHAVDFDGLELLLLELLRMPEVAEELRRQRLHVLVDEGQDTSAAQQEILDTLAPLALFVVGDPGQSIYAFRGAHMAGFIGLGARPDWRTIDLPTNYRSLPPIVEAASRLAAAMTPPGLAQEAGRTGGDARTIDELHAPAVELPGRIVDDLWAAVPDRDDCAEWSALAVLSPTWALLDELAETLSIAGIPHVVARGVLQTWDTAPARQLIDCLRVAVNPHDHAALWSALNAFTSRIGMGAWAKVRAHAMATGTTALDALAAGREAAALVDAILALHLRLAAGAQGWPAEADALIARLRAELELLHLDGKVADLGAVERAVCAWGGEHHAEGWTVRDLLDWYAGRHVTDAGADPEPPNAVTLTTIHGCVSPDTLVETPDGLLPIADLGEVGTVGTALGTRAYHNKVSYVDCPMLRITTKFGYQLEVTENHGLYTWRSDAYVRVEARDLRPRDFLRLRLGVTVDAAEAPVLPALPLGDVRAVRHSVPARMTTALAEFLGILISGGTVYERGFRVSKTDRVIAERFAVLCREIFALEVAIVQVGSTWIGEVNSVLLAEWLLLLGGVAPGDKRVPNAVLRAPRAMHVAFLRGLFEDATVNEADGRIDHIAITSAEALLRVAQTMLLRLEITSSRFFVPTQSSWRLALYGENARRFRDVVGLLVPDRQARLLAGTFGAERRTSVPVDPRTLTVASCPNRSARQNGRLRGHLSRASVEAHLPGLAESLMFHHDRIASIERFTGPSMCVTVPDGERFLQNGFDGANSKGLEWPCVWVLGCEEGLLPRVGDVEEPRRLAYVAITRGRERVRMCWAEEERPSRFIAEALGRARVSIDDLVPPTPPEIGALDLDLPF